MNQIIENLIRKPEPVKRICRVVEPLVGMQYKVRDAAGRLSVVDATQKWSVGAGVTVAQGWIVGSAPKFSNPRVYEV